MAVCITWDTIHHERDNCIVRTIVIYNPVSSNSFQSAFFFHKYIDNHGKIA